MKPSKTDKMLMWFSEEPHGILQSIHDRELIKTHPHTEIIEQTLDILSSIETIFR